MVPLPIVQPETAGAVCGEKTPDVRVVALSFLWRALSVSVWSSCIRPTPTADATVSRPLEHQYRHYHKGKRHCNRNRSSVEAKPPIPKQEAQHLLSPPRVRQKARFVLCAGWPSVDE